jgi:hypothetical protein
MVEVIHEHEGTSDNSGSSMDAMVGVLLAVVLILFLFYYFGRGLISEGGTTTPQVNIPDKVDVNVNRK